MLAATPSGLRDLSLPVLTQNQAFIKFKEIIWNIVSLIIFPIGLYRICCYELSKHVFSKLIVPSTTFPKPARIDLQKNATQFTIQTAKGNELDSVQVISSAQNGTAPREQKWLMFFCANGAPWQHQMDRFYDIADCLGINILCVNYSASGTSTSKRANSLKEIFSDCEHGLQYLQRQGVLDKNIVFHGHSLGGAPALHLGAKYKIHTIVQNSFSRIGLIIPILLEMIRPYIVSYLKDYKEFLLRKQESKIIRAICSLKDLIGSTFHLAFRVSYFALSCLENLVRGQFKEAALDALEIGKTLLIDTAVTITGLISLILSPFTDKINQFNGKLNSFFIDRSAVHSLFKSSRTSWCIERILTTTGWNVDGTKAAIALGDKLIVIQAPNDPLITAASSLATALLKKARSAQLIFLPEEACHNTIASPVGAQNADQILRNFLIQRQLLPMLPPTQKDIYGLPYKMHRLF